MLKKCPNTRNQINHKPPLNEQSFSSEFPRNKSYDVGLWLRELFLQPDCEFYKTISGNKVCICLELDYSSQSATDGATVYKLTDSDLSIRGIFTSDSLKSFNDSLDSQSSASVNSTSTSDLSQCLLVLKEFKLIVVPAPEKPHGEVALEILNFVSQQNARTKNYVQNLLHTSSRFVSCSEDSEIQKQMNILSKKRKGCSRKFLNLSSSLDSLHNELQKNKSTINIIYIPPELEAHHKLDSPGTYIYGEDDDNNNITITSSGLARNEEDVNSKSKEMSQSLIDQELYKSVPKNRASSKEKESLKTPRISINFTTSIHDIDNHVVSTDSDIELIYTQKISSNRIENIEILKDSHIGTVHETNSFSKMSAGRKVSTALRKQVSESSKNCSFSKQRELFTNNVSTSCKAVSNSVKDVFNFTVGPQVVLQKLHTSDILKHQNPRKRQIHNKPGPRSFKKRKYDIVPDAGPQSYNNSEERKLMKYQSCAIKSVISAEKKSTLNNEITCDNTSELTSKKGKYDHVLQEYLTDSQISDSLSDSMKVSTSQGFDLAAFISEHYPSYQIEKDDNFLLYQTKSKISKPLNRRMTKCHESMDLKYQKCDSENNSTFSSIKPKPSFQTKTANIFQDEFANFILARNVSSDLVNHDETDLNKLVNIHNSNFSQTKKLVKGKPKLGNVKDTTYISEKNPVILHTSSKLIPDKKNLHEIKNEKIASISSTSMSVDTSSDSEIELLEEIDHKSNTLPKEKITTISHKSQIKIFKSVNKEITDCKPLEIEICEKNISDKIQKSTKLVAPKTYLTQLKLYTPFKVQQLKKNNIKEQKQVPVTTVKNLIASSMRNSPNSTNKNITPSSDSQKSLSQKNNSPSTSQNIVIHKDKSQQKISRAISKCSSKKDDKLFSKQVIVPRQDELTPVRNEPAKEATGISFSIKNHSLKSIPKGNMVTSRTSLDGSDTPILNKGKFFFY